MASCSPQPKQEEHLVGEIPAWGNDTLFVKYTTFNGEEKYEVIYAENGRFSYTLKEEMPVIFSVFNQDAFVFYEQGGFPLIPESRLVKVILTPEDRIQVSGDVTAGGLDYQITGSDLAKGMSGMRKELLPQQKEADEREIYIYQTSPGLDMEGQYELYNELQGLQKRTQNAELAYALRHPDNEVAAFVLSTQPLDTLKKYLPSLSSKVQKGIFADIFARRMSDQPAVTIELPAE